LLQELPVHTLKIDRSFVQCLGAEGGRATFVRAIIEFAQGLELTVVAEGIERMGHVAALRKLGCRVGQGFYFAKPLTPATYEAFVRDHRGRSAA
jgi:diguanylate cyclase